MNLEVFAVGSSRVHRLDPRVKLLATAVFATVVAVRQELPVLVLSLALALVLVLAARLQPGALGRRLLLVNGFVVFLWLFLPFTHPGQTVWQLGPLRATDAGLRLALTLTIRSNAIVLATIALIGTTPVFQLVHALQHLHLPPKLVHLAFFCYRYVEVIQREYLRLRQAMRVRCFQPRTSLHTYTSYAYLVGMLLVRSYERSERVYQAMLCRGFTGSFPVYRHFQLQPADLAFAGLAGVATAALAVL